jgi:hypothetical protein
MLHLEKHSARDKKLIALARELKRLRHAQWSAPIVPLEKPYQRGWTKTFILTPDVARRYEVTHFRTVLAAINQVVRSRNREFLSERGNPIILSPRKIRMKEWRQLAWPASHKVLFTYGHWPEENDDWIPQRHRRFVEGFKLTRTWWLTETVQPWMITHKKVDLPEVRARIAEIENHLEKTMGWYRYWRLRGVRQNRWNEYCHNPIEVSAAESYSAQLAEAMNQT